MLISADKSDIKTNTKITIFRNIQFQSDVLTNSEKLGSKWIRNILQIETLKNYFSLSSFERFKLQNQRRGTKNIKQ